LRRELAVAVAVVLLSLMAVFAAYLLFAVPGYWFSSAASRTWQGADLTLTEGVGRLTDGVLVITAPDATNTIVVSVVTDFASGEYPGVLWSVQGLPADAEVRLLWRSDVGGKRTNIAGMVAEAGQARLRVLNHEPAWNGRIEGLALAIRLMPASPLTEPLRVRSVTATPMSAFAVVGMRVREWLTFEGFNGTTINTLVGGADLQSLPLPPFAATVVVLAGLMLVALRRFVPQAYKVRTGVTLAALFVAAWLVVDMRWAWNLAQQTYITLARYEGKNVDERHRVAEDGALYAFIQQARALMPAAPVRVFVAANEHYFRGRAAYHLYPENVQFEAFRDKLVPAESMRPGDWILVYRRRGMQYDAVSQLLRWDGGTPIKAELKLAGPDGAALFLVR
jgi:hypothetical protein